MKAHLRTPLALLVLLLACDSGPSQGQASADAKAEVKADGKVQYAIDKNALAEAAARANADAAADAKLAADADARLAADVAADVTVPPLKAVADVEAALGGEIALKAADLDLNGVVELIGKGELRTAAELELLLNAPGVAVHRVDIDADGKLDYLQVVEVRAGGAVNFELRAIPSSKLDASLAVLVATLATVRAEAEGAIKVLATYGAAVDGGAEFTAEREFKAEFEGAAVTLVDVKAGAFVAWAVDVSRPAHVSVHLAPADVQIGVDGSAQFVGDVSASIEAARLAALRAAIKLDAALTPPKLSAKAGAKAKAGLDVDKSAKAESSVKVGSSGGVKVGSGVKAEGSVGVSVGGGISVGGGASGKAGAGIKIGK